MEIRVNTWKNQENSGRFIRKIQVISLQSSVQIRANSFNCPTRKHQPPDLEKAGSRDPEEHLLSNKIEEHFEFFTRTLRENFTESYLLVCHVSLF